MDVSSDMTSDVSRLYKEGNWREIVEKYHNAPDRSKLLWVFLSEENLGFIDDVLKINNLKSILSIGCGSGLLEWIISQALDVPVLGVEVDDAWWNCKYAPPTFIPLHMAKLSLNDDDATKKLLENDSAALMFCYFNNRTAFLNYLDNYRGSTLIIIGPGEGRNTHTDPTPFEPEIDESWTLSSYCEVRSSKDYVAVYAKTS